MSKLDTNSEPRDETGVLAIRPQEQLLIDALTDYTPSRVLCTSQGAAQLAAAAARLFPHAAVYCHYLDLYPAEKARQYADNQLPNLTLGCSPDFPPQAIDLAALPLAAEGDAELTRDLLQMAHQRLQNGGTLMVSTDNPRDRWLHEEMRIVVRQRRPSRVAPWHGLPRSPGPPVETAAEFRLRVRFSRPRPLASRRQPSGRLLAPQGGSRCTATHGGHGDCRWRPRSGTRLRQRNGVPRSCLPGNGGKRCGRRLACPSRRMHGLRCWPQRIGQYCRGAQRPRSWKWPWCLRRGGGQSAVLCGDADCPILSGNWQRGTSRGRPDLRRQQTAPVVRGEHAAMVRRRYDRAF